MLGGLGQLLGFQAERRLHELVWAVDSVLIVVVAAAVSLGFLTFAAYAALADTHGRVAAALVMALVYAAIAGGTWAVWSAHKRSVKRREAEARLAHGGDLGALLGLFSGGGTMSDRTLAAGMDLGRQLTPMQLALVALIGGLVAGRKLDR